MQVYYKSPAHARGTRNGVPPPDVNARASDIGAPLQTSFFPSLTATKRPAHMDVREVLELIRSGTYQRQVEAVRKAPSKAERDHLKAQLPLFTPSGTFEERKGDAVIQHSGLGVVDFDKVPGDELGDLRAMVQANPHTFAAFTSPSGNGLKVLFRIPADAKRHADAWAAAAKMYAHPCLDPSGKDIARACFVSWDPDLYINEGAVELPVPELSVPTVSAIDEARVQAFLREAERIAAGRQQEDTDDPVQVVLDGLREVDIRAEAGLGPDNHIARKHTVVVVVRQLLEQAEAMGHPLADIQGTPRIYGSGWWHPIDERPFALFLQRAAIAIGVDEITAAFHETVKHLRAQFQQVAHLEPPADEDRVLINLENGVLDIGPDGRKMRPAIPEDVLLYRLPFPFDPDANAKMFRAFLDEVLPDKQLQDLVAEHIAACFLVAALLKVEGLLVLYGSGANGKSTLLDILTALFGGEVNVTHIPLEALTKSETHRAQLAGRLLNIASEVSPRLNADELKKITSGEPTTARHLYGRPFTLVRYARTIAAANELPSEVEQTHGFFRRIVPVPMDRRIPEQQQDRQLAGKIIASELPGVLNWILGGLDRLLKNKGFTRSDVVDRQRDAYRTASDTVRGWSQDVGLTPSPHGRVKTRELHAAYKTWCRDAGHHPVSLTKFSPRLRDMGFEQVHPGNVSHVCCEPLNTVSDAF